MTKTLKPVLALSLTALTLLAGCAKGDANTAYSKAKKEIKEKYAVKSFDKAFYSHADVNKWLKSDEGKDASDEAKANAKEKGNTVSVTYTFTLKDDSKQIWVCSYSTKSKEFSNANASLVSLLVSVDTVYSEARSAAEKAAEKSSYVTFGDLKK